MKTSVKLLQCALIAATLPAAHLLADPDNPNIDMSGYLLAAKEAAAHRESHRVTELEFIWMSKEPGAVILDTRSATEFRQMHIARAINLSFAEIDFESLHKRLPDKNTRVLVYCNNNFMASVLSRQPRAALNLPTYVALYSYGYRNVYELAPLIDPRSTLLNLVPPPRSEELFKRTPSADSTATFSQPATPSLTPAAAPQLSAH